MRSEREEERSVAAQSESGRLVEAATALEQDRGRSRCLRAALVHVDNRAVHSGTHRHVASAGYACGEYRLHLNYILTLTHRNG